MTSILSELEQAILHDLLRTWDPSDPRNRTISRLENAASNLRTHKNATTEQAAEALWSLVARRLVYFELDAGQNYGFKYWHPRLTTLGSKVARNQDPDPDYPPGYLQDLRSTVSGVSDTVFKYAREAVHSYSNELFMASAVMLGVASEAAFLEMAEEFCSWLARGSKSTKFCVSLRAASKSYFDKFNEFRNTFSTHQGDLPKSLTGDIDVTFNSIANLLRLYRNRSGHPEGIEPSATEIYMNLMVFKGYVRKIYELKDYFRTN